MPPKINIIWSLYQRESCLKTAKNIKKRAQNRRDSTLVLLLDLNSLPQKILDVKTKLPNFTRISHD